MEDKIESIEELKKSVEELKKSVKKAKIKNFILGFFTIVGVPLAIYFYIVPSKHVEPAFIKETTKVISNKIKNNKDITIQYKGNKVDEYNITRIEFKNKGNLEINNTDIKNDEVEECITFKISDGKFFDEDCIRIIDSSDKNNKFQAGINYNNEDNMAWFTCSYLGKGQYCTLELIHTGTDITIDGKILGFDEDLKFSSDKEFFEESSGVNQITYIFVILCLIISLKFISNHTLDQYRKYRQERKFDLLFVLNIINIGVILGLIWKIGTGIFRNIFNK